MRKNSSDALVCRVTGFSGSGAYTVLLLPDPSLWKPNIGQPSVAVFEWVWPKGEVSWSKESPLGNTSPLNAKPKACSVIFRCLMTNGSLVLETLSRNRGCFSILAFPFALLENRWIEKSGFSLHIVNTFLVAT